MRIFDTHAHLCDERFDADRDALIQSFQAKGVELVMNVACSMSELDPVIVLAKRYPFIYAACGIHPHSASEMKDGDLDRIAAATSEDKVRALGEIGLDYHYDFSPRDVQKRVFIEQLELAESLKKPVVLHIREAFGDCMDILRAHKKGLKGVMHCFSGSAETMKECLDLGLFIAFGGAITFNNARKNLEAASLVPLDRLVFETDCPYMTPVPHRKERNDPTFIPLTVRRLAQERGMDEELLAQAAFDNGMKLFELN